MAILNYISNINANNNSGDKMKLYVYDKFNKYSNKLADKISKYYDVKLFKINDNTELKGINNIAIIITFNIDFKVIITSFLQLEETYFQSIKGIVC